MALENYMNGWRYQGFAESDLAGGGSDRFIDALVAWGGEERVRARIDAHFAAGADHVCVQPIHPEGARQPVDERILSLLAPTGGRS